MGVAFFGGRFDPFHLGHLEIIQAVLALPFVTRLHVIPSAIPPHKSVLASFLLRVGLIKYHLDQAGLHTVIVDTQENDRTGHSYTIDTITSLERQYPNTPLYMVIGSDTVSNLNTWHAIDAVLARVHLIIAKRPGFDFDIPDGPRPPIILETHNPSAATILRDTHPAYQFHTIGITGRVGSGKSTAAKCLSETLGIRVIDLDKLGHAILSETHVKEKLARLFSRAIIGKNGEIDRATLGTIVFGHSKSLQLLNDVVHPILREKAIKEIKSIKTPCILVGALLAELKLLSVCKQVLVIDADPQIIEAHVGEKFRRIEKTQRSRESYQTDGTVITNTYDESFQKTLIKTVLSKLALT